MLACVMTCLGLFVWMKKYFFFHAWREAVLLPTCDMVTVVDIRSHMSTRQFGGNLFATWWQCCSLERCFVANNGIYCSEMLVEGAARVQLRDPCSLALAYIWGWSCFKVSRTIKECTKYVVQFVSDSQQLNCFSLCALP